MRIQCMLRVDSLFIAYTASVLVITPSENAEDFVAWNVCPWACAKLLASTSPASTPKEAGLVRLLLEDLASPDKSSVRVEVVKALRNTADRWNDVDLFIRACRACGLRQCLEAMSVEGMVSACQAFDWVNLSSIFTEIHEQSTSNVSRRELTVALRKCAAELGDKEMAKWCHTQSRDALNTIQQLDAQDISWAIAMLHSKKDPATYAHTTFFPQLCRVQPQNLSVWELLFSAVLANTRPKAEITAMAKAVKMALSRLANAIPAYPSTAPHGMGFRPFTTIEPMSQFTALCLRHNAPEALSSIFDRMWQEWRQQQHRAATSGYHPPSWYYLSVVNLLERHTSARPELKPHFHKFYQQAAQLLLSGPTVTYDPVTLLKLIRNLPDPVSTLAQIFTVDFIHELGKDRCALKLAAETISKYFRPLAIPSTSKTLGYVLQLCLAELIRTFDNKGVSLYPYSYMHIHGVQSATELIELCLTLKIPAYAGHILGKLLSGPETNGEQYIRLSLVAILDALPKILQPHRARVDEMPWSAFTAAVLKRYTLHVLGAKPPPFVVSDSTIEGLSCGCSPCNKCLLPLLRNTNESGKIQQMGPVRAHIEKRLEYAGAKSWGIRWETSRSGRPFALVVCLG
ncbi:hypothetical protein CYLTODRAFT_126713 [Cylindrobasidium torrendii FP15055 ss-10]|uniref:ARM repeat-containing protein n=1 Tax=Cylindrobasidium torrendii FP15055 ss-10 TaxID=1314674 RepID=A0A0D7B0K9_9AGAR|nr:hypothetical protein CYLTODRAFT_126713 [Cylindrobasidium torrendii FP15055 ss-10]